MNERIYEVVGSDSEYDRSRSEWNQMVSDDPDGLNGLDATTTFEWFQSLKHGHAQGRNAVAVKSVDGSGSLAIIPAFCIRSDIFGDRLQMVSDIYGGRNGPLVRGNDHGALLRCLRLLDDCFPRWLSIEFTVMEGSHSDLIIRRSAELGRYGIESEFVGESPFIHLQATSESFRSQLSKGFLQNIRSSIRKADQRGVVRYIKIDQVSQFDQFWHALEIIEEKSWKQSAGTSITSQQQQLSFYKHFIPVGLKTGLVRSMIMYIDDEPISYQLGVGRDKVYSCLKTSMVDGLGALRPSYLLKLELFDWLRSTGFEAVDLMGNVEPHKLVWANPVHTYRRVRIRLRRNSSASRIYFMLRKVKEKLGRVTNEWNTSVKDGSEEIEQKNPVLCQGA